MALVRRALRGSRRAARASGAMFTLADKADEPGLIEAARFCARA